MEVVDITFYPTYNLKKKLYVWLGRYGYVFKSLRISSDTNQISCENIYADSSYSRLSNEDY